jgi:selenocysteine lyase/cysteine desulfurase
MNFHSHFPILEKYTYLNTAYSGLLSVEAAEWRANHDKEFVAGGSKFREKSALVINELRTNISDLFGAKEENTFLVPNFSFGFNTLLNGLDKSHRFLLLKEDYPSIVNPVARMGFDYRDVVIDENMEENILETIKSFKPTVFAFSLVQYISGFRISDNFLQKIKSENPEIFLIADGTQFTGTTRFDFSKSSLDALIGSGYKWLLGGYGNGYVFLSDQMRDELYHYRSRKIVVSSPANFEIDLRLLFEPGHLDSLNFGSLNQSVNYLRTVGLDFIEKTNEELCNAARNSFYSKGMLPEWMNNQRQQSTIINLPLSDETIEKMDAAGILSARRGKGLRISFHFYNTPKDLKHFLKLLK